MVTSEYVIECMRVLFHLYRLLHMRYSVKKSQDTMGTEQSTKLTRMIMRRQTTSPHSDMKASTSESASTKPSSGCDGP